MNKVFLIGRLTADPVASTLDSGASYCRFSIAVNRISKSDDNKADFINIISWNALAQTCVKYLVKGSQVAIVGSIQTGSYEKDGVKRQTFDVRADQVEFLGRANGQGDGTAKPQADSSIDSLQPVEDDMPF